MASASIIFTPFVDTSTGLSMVGAICAALYAREKTGRGQKIEAALLATALGIQGSRFLCVEGSDGEAQRAMLEELKALQATGHSYQEVQAHYQVSHVLPPGNIYYRTYETSDGVLVVGCLSDPLRKRLLEVLGLWDRQFDPDYDPSDPKAGRTADELTAEAERLFRARTTGEWLAILDEHGVPAGPVKFTEELFQG